MATPISSPTGASCSDARSTSTPRAATVDAVALGGAGGRLERLAVVLVEVGRLGRVADVDGGEAAVLGHLPAARERVGDLGDALAARLTRASAPAIAAFGRGVGDLALLAR